MEISGASLQVLFTSFDTIFQRAFDAYPSYFADIATPTKSSSKATVYPWMKRTPQMREWLGERVLQAIEATAFTVINRKFEATEEIQKDDLEDDQQGIYEPLIAELGKITRVHPDLLIFGMIRNGILNVDNPNGASIDLAGVSIPVPICYDGKTFFSESHPVGPAGDTTPVANIDSSGGPINPYWFLLDASRVMRPFIYQIRRPFKAVHMAAPTDEYVFNRDAFRYGVDGRDAAAPSLWQLAYASNSDLSDPANYDKVRTAMRSIKNDNGLPFGSWASRKGRYLVVPLALEGIARRLLHNEFGPGEGAMAATPQNNIWLNDADLIVSEYLSL